MWLDVFNANPYGTNCWLLSPDGDRRRGRGGPRASRRTPCTSCSQAAGKTPVAVLATHGHGDHVGEAGAFAARAADLRARGRRGGVHRRDRLERRVRQPGRPGRRPAHDRRRRRAEPRRLARSACCTRPATPPATACSVVDGGGRDLLGRPGVRRARSVDRTSRTPTRRRCPPACPVPRACPTTCRCCPGTVPRRRWGASAPRTRSCGSRSDGARAAARHAGPAARPRRRDARAVRARRTRRRASSGTGTSRRRRSNRPSCSRGPRARRPTS